SAQIAIESAICGRSQKSIRIKPLGWFAENDWSDEIGIDERTHRIPRVAIVRGVVTELWGKWETRLRRQNAVNRPAAHDSVAPALQTVCDRLSFSERQCVNRIDHADVSHVVCGEAVVSAQVEGIRDQAGSVGRCGGI